MPVKQSVVRSVLAVAGAVLLIVVVATDMLYSPGHSFLLKTSGTAMANLGGVAALKIAAGFTGVLEGLSDILDKIMNFMLLSNLMILLQVMLLELSRSLLVKVLVVACLAAMFVPALRSRILLRKLLIVLLVVNPGLALYLTGVGLLSRSAAVEMGGRITRELNIAAGGTVAAGQTNGRLPTPAAQAATNVIAAPETRTESAAGLWPQIRDSFDRMKLAASGRLHSAISAMDRVGDVTRYALAGALEKLLALVLNYFVSVLLLFILLPFLYFYVLLTLLKDLFRQTFKAGP
jgi:hypothetical protein